MRIAVATRDFRRIASHAGKALRFLVYDVAQDQPPQVVDRLEMSPDFAMHTFQGEGPHPLDVVTVVIAGSAGPGFIRRMAARGIAVITTDETDPVIAIADFRQGRLAPAPTVAGDGGSCCR